MFTLLKADFSWLEFKMLLHIYYVYSVKGRFLAYGNPLLVPLFPSVCFKYRLSSLNLSEYFALPMFKYSESTSKLQFMPITPVPVTSG